MLLPLLQLLAPKAHGEYSYVVRGATVKCSEGTDTSFLNLPQCHGVYARGKPVMNIADNVVDANIGCFGICRDTGTVCTPMIANKWTDGKHDVLVENEPALLSKSELICTVKGIITIEKDGQD
ncbi:DUF4280 domain-containing protein [Brevibacillus fortis]|uniref:DUF4280 domain-containing protein n=1 Tax=Brevibacillus fortis TaxID=2126352 RepID=UPI002E1A0E45|nr:DUF4280 domain-containing protein [Brevibacillus fortis]